ncbi:hypothetical protein PRUPE_5G180700 [Prunus persica]|uniref:EDS1 EP domain-containing protein n=1 Tax=Prunus persica TaxID=3760 RepID=A0A251PA66_PRUPE|nr:hypothetical protein PRUPE_5G180700 [Prunus persica]
MAALATIRFLEKFPNADSGTFFCATFGSPLVGNRIISHALRRENWSKDLINSVMRYDIVPRILLAPLSSIQQQFEKILPFFDPKWSNFKSEIPGTAPEALHLYTNVMRNASALTSHDASQLMGSTNLLLETVKHFIKLSPYKPFGTYVFCTGNGKLVVLKNPEAVLQTLFYSCQLSSETERAALAHKCLDMQNVVEVDKLEELCLGSDGYLDDLGLVLEDLFVLIVFLFCVPKLRIREAKTSKPGKDWSKMEEMTKLEDHRALCEHNRGYYDAFKISNDTRDSDPNVYGMKLFKMLRKYELPDEFEAIKKWIQLGTRYPHLVGPLDIANYYRHSRGELTRRYMKKGGRPKLYKYTQRWLEHYQKLQIGTCGESCFWAEVEELLKQTQSAEAI